VGIQALQRDDSGVGITVVIVDDHAGFRAMARRMLEDAGFDVLGEASDGASGLRVVKALQPKLVLVDIQLPDLDGFTVASRLAEAGGNEIVILTSSRSGADYGSRLARNPAKGFIGKVDLTGPSLAGMLDAS
jgi:DNA-binding NarL/FixJ family response regulator